MRESERTDILGAESRDSAELGEGPGLRAQTGRPFPFPATRIGEQHSLEAGGRDDGEHTRKVEI